MAYSREPLLSTDVERPYPGIGTWTGRQLRISPLEACRGPGPVMRMNASRSSPSSGLARRLFCTSDRARRVAMGGLDSGRSQRLLAFQYRLLRGGSGSLGPVGPRPPSVTGAGDRQRQRRTDGQKAIHHTHYRATIIARRTVLSFPSSPAPPPHPFPSLLQPASMPPKRKAAAAADQGDETPAPAGLRRSTRRKSSAPAARDATDGDDGQSLPATARGQSTATATAVKKPPRESAPPVAKHDGEVGKEVGTRMGCSGFFGILLFWVLVDDPVESPSRPVGVTGRGRDVAIGTYRDLLLGSPAC